MLVQLVRPQAKVSLAQSTLTLPEAMKQLMDRILTSTLRTYWNRLEIRLLMLLMKWIMVQILQIPDRSLRSHPSSPHHLKINNFEYGLD